jgi:beta-lactamase regulating signal transducer with metallopeptidase domain
MTSIFNQPLDWLQVLLDVSLKSAVILLAAYVVSSRLRRASAALRHLIWSSAIGGVLALPLLTLALPGWRIHVISSWPSGPAISDHRADKAAVFPEISHPSDQGKTGELMVRSTIITPFRPPSAAFDRRIVNDNVRGPIVPALSIRPQASVQIDWARALLIVWITGVSIVLARLAGGIIKVWRLTRRALQVTESSWVLMARGLTTSLRLRSCVTLLMSEEVILPMTWGAWRSVILLPKAAESWSDECRGIVLLHELAHVKRRDCLTQTIAQLACAFQWFNPLVWVAAKRLRVERELACDDQVLDVGTKASDYAGHLVEIAGSLGGTTSLSLVAVGMACSQLENRVKAILDPRAQRRGLNRLAKGLVSIGAVCLILPLAIVQLWDKAEASHQRSDSGTESRQSLTPAPSEADRISQQTPHLSPSQISRPSAPNRESLKSQLESDNVGDKSDLEWGEEEQKSEIEVGGNREEGEVRVLIEGRGFGRDIGQGSGQGSGKGSGQEAGQGSGQGSGQGVGQGAGKDTELTADQLIEMKLRGVTPEFIESMRKQGLDNLTMRQLVELRVHGINEEFVRQARAWGDGNLTVRDLVKLKSSGVSQEYINSIKQAGYGNLTINQLSRMRMFNVTPEYITALRGLGYDNLSPSKLTEMRVHGVTEDFIKDTQRWTGGRPTINELLRIKIHGVSPEYAGRMKALGFDNLSIETLTRMRIHGVNEEYVKEMRGLGFDNLTVDQLIRMRIHGVDADYIKKMRASGFKNISIDQLIDMKIHGIDRILLKNGR